MDGAVYYILPEGLSKGGWEILNGYCLLTRLCGRVSRSGVELKVQSYKNEVFFIVIWTEQSIIFLPERLNEEGMENGDGWDGGQNQ